MPLTAMMYRFLAPVLSAQFMTADVGNANDVRNLLPAVAVFLPILPVTTAKYRQTSTTSVGWHPNPKHPKPQLKINHHRSTCAAEGDRAGRCDATTTGGTSPTSRHTNPAVASSRASAEPVPEPLRLTAGRPGL